MSYQVVFFFLCFFVLGFLSVVGFISFFLNYYFKSKAYFFYLGYIIATSIYISVVFINHGQQVPKNSMIFLIAEYIYDPIQVLSYFFHTTFAYYSIVVENKKFKKMFWLIKTYSFLLLIYLIMAVIQSKLHNNIGVFFEISRITVYIMVIIFLVQLAKDLSSTNLRLIFAALFLFLTFSILAFWDATLNSDNSTFLGFQYICIGYVLENICFATAFIYKIISTDKQKKADEILHQKQLVIVEQEMQKQTMQYLGREIHDNVGQKLILASIGVQQLTMENLAPELIVKIEDINSTLNTALSELRLLSKSMTNNEIENNKIITLIKSECKEINKIKKCSFLFNEELSDLTLEYQIKIILVRIIQEFSQNSIKHAICSLITIDMRVDKNVLYLSLTDDGRGFDSKHPIVKGIGLKNMKKRVALIGGNYDLQSNEETGTKLLIEIPY